jgi:phi13 family phage major tail protein
MDTQYADNQPFDVMTSEGPTNLSVNVTGIPIAILDELLGKVFDVASGREYDAGGGATPPEIALGWRSLKSNGKYKYVWYLKGRFSPPKEEAATKTDKAEPKPQELLFTAIKTIHKFTLSGTVTDGLKRLRGDEDSTAFDPTGWFLQVQVPGTTTPSALALSSSVPVDDATGVSKTANLTLTFNNALDDDAVNRVTLLNASNAVVAGAITLDATKKIITVDPTASLAGSTAHTLVAAVTDIYGQHLTCVVTFTTAA